MRKLLSLLLLLATVVTAFAQQPVTISASGGINNTTSSVKDKGYLGNGYNIQANVFIPFLSKNDGKFALGVLAGGGYFTAKNLIYSTDNLKAQYKLYSGSLDINNNGKTTNSGFTTYLGIQADFAFGPLVLSPSVSGGYFHLKQNGFEQTSDIQSNGTKQTVTLSQLQETKRTGFVTVPQLKIGYPLTSSFSIYASAGMNICPKMNITQRRLEPNGGFNNNNTYEPAQLSAGKMIEVPTVSTSYRAMMLNLGVSWSLGRKLKKMPTMPSRLSMTPTTTRQTQNNTFGEKVANGMAAKTNNPLYEDKGTQTTSPIHQYAKPGQPIKGVIVKGGKKPGGNLITTRTNNNGRFELNSLTPGLYTFSLDLSDVPQGKSISEKGLKRSDAQEAAIARPGNPIGGIIVKGGKNPGGGMTNLSVDQDGSIQFEVLEAGDYKFIIQAPENPNESNPKNKGGKVVEKATSGLKDVVKTQV